MEPKTIPNYLKFIVTIIAVLFIVLILLSIFSQPISGVRNNQFQSKIGNLEIPPEILSNNFVSYIKEQIITKPSIGSQSPVKGNSDAPITIFEFSCFSCPTSRVVQPVLKTLLEKYPNEIQLVWKDLLIPDLYPEAEELHLAARCAGNQNEFWAYHDKLWQSTGLTTDDLYNLADELDLNKKEFKKCLDNKELLELISDDVAEAGQLAIPGTPHFYINEQEISGSASSSDFEKIIEIELNR